jgi:hypothetical protein
MIGGYGVIAKAAAALAACASFATVASAADVAIQPLDSKEYHAFVVNWTPSDKPLCAALQSEAQWAKVVHPAPLMFEKNVFGPQPGFWADHAVLLIARVVQGGGGDAFKSYRVHTSRSGIEVAYALSPRPSESYTTKAYLALAVAKPLAGRISFIDRSGLACRLDLTQRVWVSPDITKRAGGAAH